MICWNKKFTFLFLTTLNKLATNLWNKLHPLKQSKFHYILGPTAMKFLCSERAYRATVHFVDTSAF